MREQDSAYVDKKRSSSAGIKISKSGEEAPAPPSPSRTQQSSRGVVTNGSALLGNSSHRGRGAAATTTATATGGRPKGEGTGSGRAGRRSNGAVTAVFWIMVAFGFFQIYFYSPDIVRDDHWFDKSSWKVSSSVGALSRNRTKVASSPKQVSEATAPKQVEHISSSQNEKGPSKKDEVQPERVETSRPLDKVPPSQPEKISTLSNSTAHENPIMKVLIAAGLKDIDPKDLEGLPTPETLTALYGPLDEPVVVGMETCAAYRDKVPPSDRLASVAGMFNTGTNAMAFHLRKNINIKNTWQVPWGKHRMEYVRLNHTAPDMEKIVQENVLPVILIRDPLYWLQSMCKSPYSAHWPARPKHCPNLVPDEADRRVFEEFLNETSTESFHVRIVFDKNHVVHWESLAHLWSDWYRLYLKAEYPRLMFRFEDLLLHGPYIMRRIAECAGVTVPETFHFQTGSAKGHGSHATFLDAIIKTGDLQKRVKNFTPEDLAYAAKHLDPDLMRIFRYSLPDPSSVAQSATQ